MLWTVLAGAFYKAVRLPLFDYDLWWHLASGRFMVENKVFLRTEVFSHTFTGVPWINFEWLGQILLYLTVRLWGLGALLYGKVLFCFALLLLFVYCLRNLGARGPALLICAPLAFFALKMRLYERIELFSLLLLISMVFLITAARHTPTTAFTRKTPWILMAMMILWCNLHGGFIYAVGVLALINIGARWSKEKPEFVALLDRSLTLILVGMLINPKGPRILEIFLEHADQMSGAPLFIEEWAPTTMDKAPVFWLLFFLSAIVLIVGLLKGRPQAKFWGPVVVVFLVWGTRHLRNSVLLPMVALPFLIDFFSNWETAQQWVSKKSVRLAGWMVATGGCLLLISSVIKAAPPRDIQSNRFPFGACEFLKKNSIEGHLYNTYHLGGAIEWALGPSHPVFMDGRYLFHPLLVTHNDLDQALMVNPDGSAWQAFMNSYDVDHAIVDYNPMIIPSRGRTPFSFAWANLVFPRAQWALVYWDDAGLVFLKRIPRFEFLIKKFEYGALWPYNLDQMKIMLDSKMITIEQVITELRRHHREVNLCIIRDVIEKQFHVA